MTLFSRFLLLLLVYILCSCASFQPNTLKKEEALVIKKSTKYSVVYQYRVPKWMAWAQVETFVMELNRQKEIESVERYHKDKNILLITTRGLIDPFHIGEMLEIELAYIPGPEFQKRKLSQSDFDAMNLEELRYINQNPEMFEFQTESGTEGRGAE